jgi:hypothetical protein
LKTQTSAESLYMCWPTPEYRGAFDLAAQGLNAAEGRALAVFSSAVGAVEVLKRCPGPVEMVGTGAFNAAQFLSEMQDWAWGPVKAVSLPGENVRPYAAILWAEPEAGSAGVVAGQLRRLAEPGAGLWVLATNGLRRFLPAWGAEPRPATSPLSPRGVLKLLREAGWGVVDRVGFHGLRSIAWGYALRLAESLGRPDWGDRCRLGMRAAYQEEGWLWHSATLALIHARAI